MHILPEPRPFPLVDPMADRTTELCAEIGRLRRRLDRAEAVASAYRSEAWARLVQALMSGHDPAPARDLAEAKADAILAHIKSAVLESLS